MIFWTAKESCPDCHGTGVAISGGEPTADGKAYRFTATAPCDCVTPDSPLALKPGPVPTLAITLTNSLLRH